MFNSIYRSDSAEQKSLMSAILAGLLAISPFSSMGMTASAADPAIISGDVNADGSFDVSDVVLYQKWLLSVPGVVLADWKAADFCADNELDVFDLCIMKQQLLNAAVSEPKDDVQTNYAIEFTGTTVKVSDENSNAVTAQDAVLVKDQVVTIIMPGEYTITGSSENGQLIVDVDKTAYPDGKVTLNLEGLTLSNPSTAPLYVASIDDECVISVKKGTVNTLSDGISHTDTYTDSDGEVHTIESTIFSRDDLKIKGKGTLRVNGNTADGIVCKNDLKLQNGTIEVTAVDDSIRGKDSVRIGDKDDRSNDSTLIITVTTQNGDGIQSTETDDESKGTVDIYGGTINIDAHSDGIFASRSVNVYGGDINIKTYEGGSYAAASGSQGSFSRRQERYPKCRVRCPLSLRLVRIQVLKHVRHRPVVSAVRADRQDPDSPAVRAVQAAWQVWKAVMILDWISAVKASKPVTVTLPLTAILRSAGVRSHSIPRMTRSTAAVP